MLVDACCDLLLGGRCLACGRPGRQLCPACREEVLTGAPRVHRPTPCPDGFPATVVTGGYDGAWPDLLAGYKEHGAWGIGPVLGRRLCPALEVLLAAAGGGGTAGPVLLVPMPSRGEAVRERGLDTTAALARHLARAVRRSGPVPVVRVRPALRFTRRVADSAGLGAVDRAANLSGALRLPERLARGWRRQRARVVLCDDLVTTGATLTEAARAVGAAGVDVLGAVVLVATARTSGPDRRGHG